MELEILGEALASKGCQSNPKLPRWSKTGRRTRAARTHHDDLAAEDLPPKKRKLDSTSARNVKILCYKMSTKHHRCNICKRSFSSYQALGGHKAHHNKAAAAAGRGDGGALEEAAAVCGGAVHRCTFCYKEFSKGQALGGHRRHCQGPIVNQNGAKMLSFDLNEFPPEFLGSS
ncbi:zinc finger protein ZAT10-like [Salvia divinorum]|uniref:Zinc finger protein ZAT10-like n=1 Tax=Salvia divinorum TaxID=28513 RepID=A0ABD1H9A2_SALDI